MSKDRREKNYYITMGVSPNATKRRIEAAYRYRAKQFHPDRGGDEEKMKSLNEAYAVLHDDSARAVYDAARRTTRPETAFAASVSAPATADAVYGQTAGAIISIAIGLILLLLVRFHWIWFLWPLLILAALVVVTGIFMAHNVLRIVRETFDQGHIVRRLRWVQEAIFWSSVGVAGYGVYLILASV
jgi:curved DNA-binding protein CbpA